VVVVSVVSPPVVGVSVDVPADVVPSVVVPTVVVAVVVSPNPKAIFGTNTSDVSVLVR
jgi:hypothetical protein